MNINDLQIDNYSSDQSIGNPASVLFYTHRKYLKIISDAKQPINKSKHHSKQHLHNNKHNKNSKNNALTTPSSNSSTNKTNGIVSSEPFIKFSSVRKISTPSVVTKYKYIALLVLEFYITIDTASVYLIMKDVVDPFIELGVYADGAFVIDKFNYSATSYKSKKEVNIIQSFMCY